jgi:BCD family chlorophyll transporter-like MFS transporter
VLYKTTFREGSIELGILIDLRKKPATKMKTKLQFALSKFAIAWMFALVTINFNRIGVVEFGIPAVLIATMIGMYPFFGPFQPIFGRLTERFPLFGYRRSPYLLIGMLVGSLCFPPLPSVLVGIQNGSWLALLVGFLLFFIFGTMIALMANTYLDLISECTKEEERSGVFAVAWTGQTLIIVVWASIFRLLMPTYSFESMQLLYSLTPFVVMTLAVLSVLNLERRLDAYEIKRLRATANALPKNPIRESLHLLTRNRTAQGFFLFVALCFMGIFTQDMLQEIMGAEVFQMSVGETTIFQQIFNGTVAVGMALTAALGGKCFGKANTASLPLTQKKQLATIGGLLATVSFLGIALAVSVQSLTWLYAAMAFNGLTVGVFTFAAVTMMSDMTVEGETGKYLGLWSLAQAIGLGASFIASGILHGVFIQSTLLNLASGYAMIFSIEAAFMLWCVWSLRPASVEDLRRYAIRPLTGNSAESLTAK